MAKALDPEYATLAAEVTQNTKILKNLGEDDLDQDVAALAISIEERSAMMAEIEEFAKSALATAEEIFEKRAQFVVVGQLKARKGRIDIPPNDPEAIKLSLGWYSTEGDARKAGESLALSSQTGDEFRWWLLPVHHGTPADLHAKQKEKYAAEEAARKEKQIEKFRESIKKHRQAMEERARGGKGSCESCGHQPFDHGTDGSGRGKCMLTECLCDKWREKKK